MEYLGYGRFYDYISADVEDGSGGKPYPGKTWSSSPFLNNVKYSPFPLFAYQKIYADYNRYTQWEKTNPASFNCDYIQGTDDLQLDLTVSGFQKSFNFLDMRYSNWQRDMVHGTLPVAQYGEASFVNVNGTQNVSFTPQGSISASAVTLKSNNNGLPGTEGTDDNPVLLNIDTSRDVTSMVFDFAKDPNSNALVNGGGSNVDTTFSISPITFNGSSQTIPINVQASLSILELRRAEAAQKWKEITLSAEEDYRSQILAHWNQSVSALLSDMCQYLDGFAVNLDINEVVNTNITGSNAADIAGKGTMSGAGGCSYNANGQYGILMCIFHVLPLPDYITNAPDFGTMLVDATDFPIPEFDAIGMESVPSLRLTNYNDGSLINSAVVRTAFLGYAPRYIDWKTSLDRSLGSFVSSLKTWILPFDDAAAYNSIVTHTNLPDNPNVIRNVLNAGYFKIPVQALDSLFAVAVDNTNETDQFLCSNFFDVKVVRSLDVNGLPY